ncbi:MAG: hypothetical protein II370_08495 [Clostridia bacterium]|nr:hypothetical protein [Clostridia bacterium]
MLDLLIKNGTVIDGTGKPAWSGNIGIKDGKIVFAASDADAARVIDATGKIVSPGFIDGKLADAAAACGIPGRPYPCK